MGDLGPRDGALVAVLPAFAFAGRLGFLAVIGAAGRTGFGTLRFAAPRDAVLSLGFTQVFD